MEKIKLTKREYLGEGTVIETKTGGISSFEKKIGILDRDYSDVVDFVGAYTGQIFDTENGGLNENDYSSVNGLIMRAYKKYGTANYYELVEDKDKDNFIWQ